MANTERNIKLARKNVLLHINTIRNQVEYLTQNRKQNRPETPQDQGLITVQLEFSADNTNNCSTVIQPVLLAIYQALVIHA